MIWAFKRGAFKQPVKFRPGQYIDTVDYYDRSFIIALKEGAPFAGMDRTTQHRRILEAPYEMKIVTGNESVLWWAPYVFYAWCALAIAALWWVLR